MDAQRNLYVACTLSRLVIVAVEPHNSGFGKHEKFKAVRINYVPDLCT